MNCNSNRSTLQKQFINHCVVLIQSSFKAYRQRKRYQQFLPVYRRIRELLLATFQGWKIRQIMKLQPIRAQINLIKENTKNNQLSKIRICKRQLIDQIQRLKKRGKWVEVYKKSKISKYQSAAMQAKENCLLYANIRAVKIKNIFKKDKQIAQNTKQSEIQSKVHSVRVNKRERQCHRKNQKIHVQIDQKTQVKFQQTSMVEDNQLNKQKSEQIVRNSIQQQVILPKKDFFSNLEDKLALSLTDQGKVLKNKKILRKSSKHGQVSTKTTQKNVKQLSQSQTLKNTKSTMGTFQQKYPSYQTGRKKTEQISKAELQKQFSSSIYNESIKNSRVTETNRSGTKKIKLSLTTKMKESVSESSVHSSIIKLNKSDSCQTEDLQKSQSQQKIKNRANKKQNMIQSLLLTYKSTYLQKKTQVIKKLRQIDSKFVRGLNKVYINKTNAFDSQCYF